MMSPIHLEHYFTTPSPRAERGRRRGAGARTPQRPTSYAGRRRARG